MPTPTATAPNLPVACFAPPLTDELLAKYQTLIDGLGPDQAEIKDNLTDLMRCVAAWWALPDSTRKDVRRWKFFHLDRGQHVEVVEQPLDEAHVKALWDVTPWMSVLNLLSNSRDEGLFDSLPPGELRDAAFHLLWHAKEITLDREPMTSDKV